MTYAEASALLTGPRNQDSRNIATNTYLKRRDGGLIALNLFGTVDILTYYPNGDVRYNLNGFFGQLAKSRMSRYGPEGVSIYADRGFWRLSIRNPDYRNPDPEYYTRIYCSRCGRSRWLQMSLGEPEYCPVCGYRFADNKYAHYYNYNRASQKYFQYRDGMVVHPDLSVTGAGAVIHHKQYSNHNDLFFGVFAEKSANS